MWLSDLLPQKMEIRPTRPTKKKHVGRPQTLMSVAPSDTSDTKKVKEKIFSLASTTDQPDPRTIEYALSLLVDCPRGRGKLHCWHYAQCVHTRICSAWSVHFHKVKEFVGRGKPYSLLVLEDEGLTEVRQ